MYPRRDRSPAHSREPRKEVPRPSRWAAECASPPPAPTLAAPPQHTHEKSVGVGATRRHQQTLVLHLDRAAEQEGALAQSIRDLGGSDKREFQVPGQEGADLLAILVREHRT